MTKEKFENKIGELLRKYGGNIERDEPRIIFTSNYRPVVVFVGCDDDEDNIMLINCTKIEYSTHTDEILMYRDDVYLGIGPISVIKDMDV